MAMKSVVMVLNFAPAAVAERDNAPVLRKSAAQDIILQHFLNINTHSLFGSDSSFNARYFVVPLAYL